jgi:hypothetical protein
MTGDKLSVRYHQCLWPGCHRKLKYGTWCTAHWFQIADEYKIGSRKDEQPPELIRAALGWVARSMPRQCSRCEHLIEPGSVQIRISWPWSESHDLVLDLCESCAVNLETGIGIRWCSTCNLWTKNTHPIHTRNLRLVPGV